MMTPLSIASSVSSASSVSLPGELQVIYKLFEFPEYFIFYKCLYVQAYRLPRVNS